MATLMVARSQFDDGLVVLAVDSHVSQEEGTVMALFERT